MPEKIQEANNFNKKVLSIRTSLSVIKLSVLFVHVNKLINDRFMKCFL